MANEDKGKISIWKRLYVLKHGRFPIKEQTKESILVRSLRQELRISKDIIDKQSIFIDDLSKQIEYKQQVSVQDKMLDVASKFFLPKENPPVPNPKLTTESGDSLSTDIELDDNQLKEFISGYPKDKMKMALELGDDFVFQKIKEQEPTLSDKSIHRGIQIARSML